MVSVSLRGATRHEGIVFRCRRVVVHFGLGQGRCKQGPQLRSLPCEAEGVRAGRHHVGARSADGQLWVVADVTQ
jgi:hypothetical protein